MSKKRRKTSGKVRKSKTDIHQIKQAIKQGNVDKAILLLQSAKGTLDEQKRISALAELCFRRAQCYADIQPKQALRDFMQAVKLRPDDVVYAYHLALFYHRQGQLDEAIKQYRVVVEQHADFERVRLPLAFALQENGQSPVHDPIWQKLSEDQRVRIKGDVSPSDNLTQSLIAIENQELEQAQELLQAIVADDDTTSQAQALAHDYLGRVALQVNQADIQSAITHWRHAYQLGLRSETLNENLALAYILNTESLLANNDTGTALQQVQEAIKYFPEHPRLREIQSYLLLDVGYQNALANDWDDARTHWEAVIHAEGEVARRLTANMAIAYEKLEEWGEAAASWREFARRRGRTAGAANWLSPEQVARLWSRISNLYMRVGMEDDAITTLQTALKYDPDDIEMGIDLARRYAEAGRVEASHNQIDRVTHKHPQSAKAYAFKGEVSEIAPSGWGFVNHRAINAWEKVIELRDESYDALARQRLQEVYLDAFAGYMRYGFNAQQGLNFAQEKLKQFPEFHMFRADYVGGLMSTGSDEAVIQEQLNLIDVKNERALHHLIDMCHIFDEHETAQAMLKRADNVGALDADFYVGIAQCAVNREQLDIARTYFGTALERATDAEDRRDIQIRQASSYIEGGISKEGEAILKEVLKQDPNLGPAHLAYALLYLEREKMKKAKTHLNKAEKWAKANNVLEMLRVIEAIRFQIDNPLSALLPPGIDLPPGMDVDDVLNMLDMFGFEEDFDDDEDYF